MTTCSACARVNIEGARFCEGCGAPLEKATRVARRILSIGSSQDCDLVLEGPGIAAHHARLTVDAELVLEDVSGRGVFLGVRRTPVKRSRVQFDDVVYFGSYRTTVRRLLSGHPAAKVGERVDLPREGRILLGRSHECDVFLDHASMAERQLLLEVRGERMRVTVLADEPPTHVAGRRVLGSCLIDDRAVITVGPYELFCSGDSMAIEQSRRGLSLEIRNVSLILTRNFPASSKVLLDNISLTLSPGELCGLMGLAGSGKSTLIKVCCGYRSPSKGGIMLEGHDFYAARDLFKTSIGYVPQENILFKDLTVGQTLDYAARLRLGSANDHDEASFLRLLDRLGVLESNPQILDTRVSSISGGQKRAVSIAIEMLADPAVFFLDEPTSGLSSEEAYLVMNILRRMADEGKTILISLHQPNADLYEMLDNVVYLHKGGRLAYYGPSVPDSITFTDPGASGTETKPERVLHMLEQEPADVWQERYRESRYHFDYVLARRRRIASEARPLPEAKAQTTPPWVQAAVLFRRNIDLSLQDTMNSLILFMQAPVIALLIGFVFTDATVDTHDNAPVVIYLMVIASVWFGCSNASRDICGEWTVYLRERMFNLYIVPYVLAKLAVGALICLIQCFILTLVIRQMCNLEAAYPVLMGYCTLTAIAGTSLGLLISSFAAPFAKNNEIALALVPIVLLPMVILGGVIQPYKDMNGATKRMAEITVTHWAFQAILALEAEAIPEREVVIFPDGTEKPVGHVLLDIYREDRDDPDRDLCLKRILGLMAIFGVATMVLLRFRDPS